MKYKQKIKKKSSLFYLQRKTDCKERLNGSAAISVISSIFDGFSTISSNLSPLITYLSGAIEKRIISQQTVKTDRNPVQTV